MSFFFWGWWMEGQPRLPGDVSLPRVATAQPRRRGARSNGSVLSPGFGGRTSDSLAPVPSQLLVA